MKTGYKEVSRKTNNRPLTERKLIDAVGAVIKKMGYKGLSARIIAREADVTTSLIFKYFGTLDTLIGKYVAEKDYWMASKTQMSGMLEKIRKKSGLIEMLVFVMENSLNISTRSRKCSNLFSGRSRKNARSWIISAGSGKAWQRISLNRPDPLFEGSGVNFKAVAALLVSGIYYLVLHARTNNSTQCGINISSETDRAEIIKTIRQMLQWTFDAAKAKRHTG